MVLEAGTQAPEFSLEAAVSGKQISAANGKKTVLVFHGNKTQDAPKEIGKAIRAEHPDAADVLVANVVNLKPYAGLFAKVANAQIKQTYEKLAGKIGDGAEEYVIICPDFKNEVGPLFGIDDSDAAAGIVVLDADGSILAAASGDGLSEAALGAL